MKMDSSIIKQYPEVTQGSGPDICKICCWTRPLNTSASSSNESGNESPGSGFTFLQHWVVAFQYDDEVLVCDANDVEGKLEGKCQQLSTDDFENKYPHDKKCLGKFKIAKKDVIDQVDQVKKSGSYGFISNNCQKWLKGLLENMKLPDTGYTDAKSVILVGLSAVIFAGVYYSIPPDIPRNELERQMAQKRRAPYQPCTPVYFS